MEKIACLWDDCGPVRLELKLVGWAELVAASAA